MTFDEKAFLNSRVYIDYYISGPMTGKPDHNYPYFNQIAAELRAAGYEIVNPAELNDASVPWLECLRADICALCFCRGLILLDGWEKSSGAHLELHIAHRLGMEIYTYRDFVRSIA